MSHQGRGRSKQGSGFITERNKTTELLNYWNIMEMTLLVCVCYFLCHFIYMVYVVPFHPHLLNVWNVCGLLFVLQNIRQTPSLSTGIICLSGFCWTLQFSPDVWCNSLVLLIKLSCVNNVHSLSPRALPVQRLLQNDSHKKCGLWIWSFPKMEKLVLFFSKHMSNNMRVQASNSDTRSSSKPMKLLRDISKNYLC